MSLSPGTALGPYQILAFLGAGGMGEVYRARDTRLDRTVAIKILSVSESEKSQALGKLRFDREAKTISSLNHPNICHLYDVGEQDGVSYLVMEYLEGQTLADRLLSGPIPLDQVLQYGADICEALEEAHRRGVVHRDLKPGNIMLTQTGVKKTGVKLMDFGLAKSEAPLSSGLTQTLSTPQPPLTGEGIVMGTIPYMSPEQLEGKEVDRRSDIFALGAVLYEMVTGKRAFDGKRQLSVASAILERNPAPIRSVKPLAPPALEHAIATCLAKDPEARWQTARDLGLELKWIADGDSVTGASAQAVSRQQKLREKLAWAVAGLVTLVCVALAVGFLSRRPVPVQLLRSSLLPPPGSSFLPYGFATAPDGRRLAFAAL